MPCHAALNPLMLSISHGRETSRLYWDKRRLRVINATFTLLFSKCREDLSWKAASSQPTAIDNLLILNFPGLNWRRRVPILEAPPRGPSSPAITVRPTAGGATLLVLLSRALFWSQCGIFDYDQKDLK
jgi:hypothetical protein